MPHFEAFADSVAQLNHWCFPRAVLSYQRAILEQGVFQVVCPLRGGTRTARRCLIVNNSPLGLGDMIIAYYLPEQPALWVCSGGVKDGFPITEAYLADSDEVIWSLDRNHLERNEVVRQHIRRLEALPPPAAPQGLLELIEKKETLL